MYKYLDPTATGNNDGSNNFPIIRYPDVLLMYAEALNEQAAGNVDAYAVVNRIRKRAGLSDLAGLTQAQFRDAILLERRLISAMQAQNPTIKVEERHYLLPIPQTEIDVNPSLNQNPGY